MVELDAPMAARCCEDRSPAAKSLADATERAQPSAGAASIRFHDEIRALSGLAAEPVVGNDQ